MTTTDSRRRWYAKNKEHAKAYYKEWCANHKEIIKERNRKRYLKQKELAARYG